MKKPEDTAEGCRSLARADRARAATASSAHMRNSLERSAEAWVARAQLLKRLETRFNARAVAYAGERERARAEREEHG